jgi:hypothetical protein
MSGSPEPTLSLTDGLILYGLNSGEFCVSFGTFCVLALLCTLTLSISISLGISCSPQLIMAFSDGDVFVVLDLGENSSYFLYSS